MNGWSTLKRSLSFPEPGKLANLRLFHQEIDSPRPDGTTSNAPVLLALEVTTRCNFQCVHCSQSTSHQKPADLDLGLFRRMIPLSKTAYELYLFGDGEVLLDVPRHLAMIAGIHNHDPARKLGFSTNGKLLTPQVYELYATAGVHYIQISVDAASRELYEAMRRGGSFAQLIANLEGIATVRRRLPYAPRLHLATVVSRQNYHELPELAEFARRYGFVYWYINAEYPHNPGRELLALTANDLARLERIRTDIVTRYSGDYMVFFDPSIGLSANDTPWTACPSGVFCTAPWAQFELKATGDVKVCPYFHEPITSMAGKSFPEVWNGPEFRRIRRIFASGAGLPSYCSGCTRGIRTQYLPGFPGLPDTRRITSRLPWKILPERFLRWSDS